MSTQNHFTLDLQGIAHDFKVLAFHGREAISQPYRFVLELVSERPDLDLDNLLGQPAFLAYSTSGSGVHGLIEQIAQGDSGSRLTRYHLTLAPQLSQLALRRNSRIFQHLTVPQIIAQLLEEHGIQADAYRFQLGPTVYPARDYCVQYGETDLHFVQRLCEEEGLHYHFQHNAEAHVLVFGDDQTGFPKPGRPTAYLPDSGMVATEPVIKHFGVRLETRTSAVIRRDYDFQKPRLQLESRTSSQNSPALEDYAFPGQFTERNRGKHLTQRTLERHQADFQQATGDSDQPLLASGYFLELSEHPCTEWNQLWLLTEVEHQGKQPQVLEEVMTSDTIPADGFQQGYRNRFTATPWDVPFRPPLKHPKPRLLSSQSAVVTGPAGEEIHCDEYGRVKVRFFWDREHWDRDGEGNDKSSCWLRVASGWAGNRYGSLAIPRVGVEVLVSFLEGDPDQPLITGCLHHKTHPVPYDLPAHKTRSLFKTLSSPGGGGSNELRIEDKQGAEQIYLHAQRDWEQHIRHDQTLHVGHQRHDTVVANSYSEFKAEEHHTTHGDRRSEVRADDHLSIGASRHTSIGTGQFTEAGDEIYYHAGSKVVIDAGMELTASGGGSWLKLDPGGVSLSGATIKINSGGAPGTGSGIQIKPPVIPSAANQDKAGAKPQLALANVQLQMARKARQLGASRCPICEACREGICAVQPSALTTSPNHKLAPARSTAKPVTASNTATPATSGPGKWVTQEVDYHGVRNTGMLLINRLASMSDQGRAFGSDGKDYQHTKRTLIQTWQPLGDNEQHLAASSLIRRYGEERRIEQTYLEGPDAWHVSGKSWHWQPVTATTVYEKKDAET